jgi:hypothetical protein
VSAVASAIANGTFRIFASVWARSVLPQPVVRLLELDLLVVAVLHHLDALVVVVDGDRQRPLGALLAHDVLVQHGVDLLRLREALELERGGSGELLVDDLVTKVDALVADIDARPGDQLLDLALRLSAE